VVKQLEVYLPGQSNVPNTLNRYDYVEAPYCRQSLACLCALRVHDSCVTSVATLGSLGSVKRA